MKNKILILLGIVLLFGCSKELDTKPVYELSLENLLQQDPNAVKGLVSKMYSTLSLSSANGPGSSDITGPDPGETVFLRGIINLEDFCADGIKNRWGDDGLDQLTTTTNWTPNNKFFKYLFDRVYYTVPQCTNIILAIKNTGNITDADAYISELRFLRALSYYYMIDCFGKGVLVTDENFGQTAPLPEASRVELFNYVESELLAIENTIPQTNEYGRANKATVRMLLARLYLNAGVYTGTTRYSDALTYASKVINEGGYSLASNFSMNFSADNNTSPEIIFPLIADATSTQSYGNVTYIVNGSLSSNTPIADYGATEGWTGHRATKAWYGLYGNLSTTSDDRGKQFYTTGHNYEMNNYKTWLDGYPSIKFRNTNYNSTAPVTKFSNTDFPFFRLAEAYLIYAECALRSNDGNLTTALGYVNAIRNRAHASVATMSDMTLSYILDERARELNFEGVRRMDLIRYGKFTGGSYLWPWKGGVVDGQSIPDTYNLYPIPTIALSTNPNLTQNPGYN